MHKFKPLNKKFLTGRIKSKKKHSMYVQIQVDVIKKGITNARNIQKPFCYEDQQQQQQQQQQKSLLIYRVAERCFVTFFTHPSVEIFF